MYTYAYMHESIVYLSMYLFITIYPFSSVSFVFLIRKTYNDMNNASYFIKKYKYSSVF